MNTTRQSCRWTSGVSVLFALAVVALACLVSGCGSGAVSQGSASPTPSANPSAFVDTLQVDGESAYKAACRTVTYDALSAKSAPSLLQGKHIRLTGQVVHIQEAGQGSFISGYPYGLTPETQMAIEGGPWENVVLVVSDTAPKAVHENDMVTVWGAYVGWDTQDWSGGEVPLIDAQYITRGSGSPSPRQARQRQARRPRQARR